MPHHNTTASTIATAVATNHSGDAVYRNPPPGNTIDNPAARTATESDNATSSVPATTIPRSTTASRSTKRRLTGPMRAGRSGNNRIPFAATFGWRSDAVVAAIIPLRSTRSRQPYRTVWLPSSSHPRGHERFRSTTEVFAMADPRCVFAIVLALATCSSCCCGTASSSTTRAASSSTRRCSTRLAWRASRHGATSRRPASDERCSCAPACSDPGAGMIAESRTGSCRTGPAR